MTPRRSNIDGQADRLSAERADMVDRQMRRRGIVDKRVLAAMMTVPRELFLPEDERPFAYRDRPLPIGAGQTISQPYIVALMAEAAQLDGSGKVLEIGSGSGYGAAVLSHLADRVVTVERIAELVRLARENLASAGIDNVDVVESDGSVGWSAEAPYDAIVVTAASPQIPPSLIDQLEMNGRLVIPVGPDSWTQTLTRVTKTDTGELRTEDLAAVRFVPLIGKEGFGAAS